MMTKIELRAAVERFMADKKRVISERMLCELAGISPDTLRNVFKTKIYDMTPVVQIRLEKALMAIERGEVVVTQKWDQTRQVGYRKKPEPEFRRGLGLTFKNGRIGVKTGMQNANCYTQRTFVEELEG